MYVFASFTLHENLMGELNDIYISRRSWVRVLLGAPCCARWCCFGARRCARWCCLGLGAVLGASLSGHRHHSTVDIERTAPIPGALNCGATWIKSFAKGKEETYRPQTAPVLVCQHCNGPSIVPVCASQKPALPPMLPVLVPIYAEYSVALEA